MRLLIGAVVAVTMSVLLLNAQYVAIFVWFWIKSVSFEELLKVGIMSTVFFVVWQLAFREERRSR